MTHWTEEFFVENADVYGQELKEMDEWAEDETTNLLTLISEDLDTVPSTVLDVGCGLGRHCLEFAAAGLEVTGIDISPDFIGRARERAATANVAGHTRFCELDMRELNALDVTFDLVVCLYNTFGYFDDDTNIDILRQMHDRLTPDGVCVLQVINKDTYLTDFQSTVVRDHEFGLILAQHGFESQTSRMTVTRDILRGEAPDFEYDRRLTYDMRLYSPPELTQAVLEAGFADVHLFGGFEREAPSLDRGNLVIIADKM